jgi:protein-L-isoaspartate(D-aspartate) O-methyltransferase
MVDRQIAGRGIRDPLVMHAMRTVPREAFVSDDLKRMAYKDAPLPIAAGQTISQPYIVGFMVAALGLHGGERVLEIGTGSGYAAAVLAEIAGHVYTIERIAELANAARSRLQYLEYRNVTVICGDGTLGCADHAPFDAIVVAAGGPAVPSSLKSQLRTGGKMVIPVGDSLTNQSLVRVERTSETTCDCREIATVRFVPLIGSQGWTLKPIES